MDPSRSRRASTDPALDAEPVAAQKETVPSFRNPAVCLPASLPDCDQLQSAGLARPTQIEMKDSWEGCSGRPIVMDAIQIHDLTPEEPKLLYLVLSNACSIPATFCISSARYAAEPMETGIPAQARRQEEESLFRKPPQARDPQRLGHAARVCATSERDGAAGVKLTQSRLQRHLQGLSRPKGSSVTRQGSADNWFAGAGGRNLPVDAAKMVPSERSIAPLGAPQNSRRNQHHGLDLNTEFTKPPSSEVSPLLACEAIISAPGYLSAAGQEHCVALNEEKRRASLLRAGNGFAVLTAPAAGRLPATSTRCISIELLTDLPGVFEDNLILELQAHPFATSSSSESASTIQSVFQQNLKLQVHFPLRVSSVGNALLFAPHQPSLNLTAQPCPLLSVVACIVPPGPTECSPAKDSKALPLPGRKPAHKAVIPLNALAAAAGAATAAACQRTVPRTAERTTHKAQLCWKGHAGLSPQNKHVETGCIHFTPIRPPVGTFKVFNRSPSDVSLQWRIFDLDAWDEQRREEARVRETKAREAETARNDGENAVAEVSRVAELGSELQIQSERATKGAASAAASCPIPGGAPPHPTADSQAVMSDSAFRRVSEVTLETSQNPGALTGADRGLPKLCVSVDQPAMQGITTNMANLSRERREANGELAGNSVADNGEQAGTDAAQHRCEEEQDTGIQEGRTSMIDEAKDSARETRLNSPEATLVPPNTCAIENVFQNKRASMQASGWQKDVSENWRELGQALPVLVSPERCVIKAKSTQTFRITFDGVQGTAQKCRFRLVGTGSHMPTGSHFVSGDQVQPGLQTCRCRRRNEKPSSSCSGRTASAFLVHRAPASAGTTHHASRQQSCECEDHPETEVANLREGSTEDADDEDGAWSGESRRPVSGLGDKPTAARNALHRSQGRDAPKAKSEERSDNVEEQHDSDGTVGKALCVAASAKPPLTCQGQRPSVADRTASREAARSARTPLPKESVLVLDVNASFYEPRVVVETSQEPSMNDEGGRKSEVRVEPDSSGGSSCGEAAPLCTFTATPAAVGEARRASANGDADQKSRSPVNYSASPDILRRTMYIQNPLPCDIHAKFHIEGDYFSIIEIKLDKDSVGEPYNPEVGKVGRYLLHIPPKERRSLRNL
uniref:Uncharacterized protein n=1 Tax=Neospora caninum (strain Liverpool) TaxID=572307 RepID=A0A0F7UKG4_NEOCL|nr:TPA: hypothetical protein BN1204_062668 [Neospora caninum Liverpool]